MGAITFIKRLMQKHTKIFRDFWWDELTLSQTEQCFVCGEWGADIHHLSAKSLGGSKSKDYIENLVCLCRKHHQRCHDDKKFNTTVRIDNLRRIADKLEIGNQ